MGGRLTVTVNSQGDVCAIQKGGGVGVRSSEIIRCIRIALSKAVEVTNQLKKAVPDSHQYPYLGEFFPISEVPLVLMLGLFFSGCYWVCFFVV